MRYAIPTLLSFFLAGCLGGTGFEPPTQVSDLRVLAMRLDPPEIEVPLDENADPIPVTISALVATPSGEPVFWRLSGCPFTSSQGCDNWQARDGSVRSIFNDIDAGRLEPTSGGPPQVIATATPELTPALIHDLLENYGQLGGLGGARPVFQVSALSDGVSERAMKRLQISLPDLVYRLVLQEVGIPICDENGLPEDCIEYRTRVPNTNPEIDAIRFRRIARDGEDAPEQDLPEAGPLVVAPGETIRWMPSAVEDAAEDYQTLAIDFENHTVRVEDRTEILVWSWFSTAGRFSLRDTEAEHTRGAFNTWTAPATPPGDDGDTWIWIVLRDNRGGVAFTTVHVQVDADLDAFDDDDLDDRDPFDLD